MLAEALVGHLVGDFLLQTDFMAQNKKNPHPGPIPVDLEEWSGYCRTQDWDACKRYSDRLDAWHVAKAAWVRGRHACALHCALWSLAVMLFAGWWVWWVFPVLFLTHYAQDRTQVIAEYMRVVGQSQFAKNLGPWASIAVDNTWHCVVLFVLSKHL